MISFNILKRIFICQSVNKEIYTHVLYINYGGGIIYD